MTWEIVGFFAVIVPCATLLILAQKLAPQRIEKEVNKRLAEIFDDIKILDTRVKAIESNEVGIVKALEEAKKLQSQLSLQASLGQTGFNMRGAR